MRPSAFEASQASGEGALHSRFVKEKSSCNAYTFANTAIEFPEQITLVRVSGALGKAAQRHPIHSILPFFVWLGIEFCRCGNGHLWESEQTAKSKRMSTLSSNAEPSSPRTLNQVLPRAIQNTFRNQYVIKEVSASELAGISSGKSAKCVPLGEVRLLLITLACRSWLISSHLKALPSVKSKRNSEIMSYSRRLLDHSTLFLFAYNFIPATASKSECGNFRMVWNLEYYFSLLHCFEALCEVIQTYRESNGRGVFLVSAVHNAEESFGSPENTIEPFSSLGHAVYEQNLEDMDHAAAEALLELKQLLQSLSCDLVKELENKM